MSEGFKVFSNLRTLRAQARETSFEVLEELLEKMTSIVEDRRQEEESGKKECEEKQAKLAAIREQLLADGIDPNELIANFNAVPDKQKSTRISRPAKYKFIDENGDEKGWTGQGRTPKAIAAAIESGKKLEDFLI
ncbi:H-NS family histone-like protein [Pantoea agglomerans]|uniref:H-NS family histone-like protein n=1 Tax=Enterobacter agglomerans TaxID=549 RepID=UPI000F03D460|nr:H-NS family nucleoid-associated regulatory protein [Pantoea agglomerans]AYP22234.1 DNA-binding protein [Pantoea agglomerans]